MAPQSHNCCMTHSGGVSLLVAAIFEFSCATHWAWSSIICLHHFNTLICSSSLSLSLFSTPIIELWACSSWTSALCCWHSHWVISLHVSSSPAPACSICSDWIWPLHVMPNCLVHTIVLYTKQVVGWEDCYLIHQGGYIYYLNRKMPNNHWYRHCWGELFRCEDFDVPYLKDMPQEPISHRVDSFWEGSRINFHRRSDWKAVNFHILSGGTWAHITID